MMTLEVKDVRNGVTFEPVTSITKHGDAKSKISLVVDDAAAEGVSLNPYFSRLLKSFRK